jgi:hypothetical protein
MKQRDMEWWSYHPEGDGFVLHATEAEAKADAQNALECERDEAYDGWSDSVTSICWGRVCGRATETLRRPREDGDAVAPECDEVVEYEIVDFSAAKEARDGS